MEVQLAGSNFKRGYGLPYDRLLNLLVEPMPNGKVMRFPRGGLQASYTVATGPIRGIFWVSGLFGSPIFSVSGTGLYQDSTLIGTIAGTDDVRWAASSTELVIVASGTAYLWDGTTLTGITIPNFLPVSDVVYLAGRFVYSIQGQGRFYWSEVNDAATVDPLSFATAESGPDAIIGMATLVDDLYLFGAQTVEIWAVTGDLDLPFSRPPGRLYNRGCSSKSSITYADNALFWVGENRIIYRSAAVPQRVSTFSVEQALAQCSDIANVQAWSITREGHELLIVNIPGQTTYCLDLSNTRWTEWTSYGRQVFRGRCAAMVNGTPHIGDDQTGMVGVLTTGVYVDYGAPITWLASFWIDQPGDIGKLDNIVLQGARGVGHLNQPMPATSLRLSRDQGFTFTDWEDEALGQEGEYKERAVWLRMGRVYEPGILGEIRTTDPVLCSMVQMLVNVKRPYG